MKTPGNPASCNPTAAAATAPNNASTSKGTRVLNPTHQKEPEDGTAFSRNSSSLSACVWSGRIRGAVRCCKPLMIAYFRALARLSFERLGSTLHACRMGVYACRFAKLHEEGPKTFGERNQSLLACYSHTTSKIPLLYDCKGTLE